MLEVVERLEAVEVRSWAVDGRRGNVSWSARVSDGRGDEWAEVERRSHWEMRARVEMEFDVWGGLASRSLCRLAWEGGGAKDGPVNCDA